MKEAILVVLLVSCCYVQSARDSKSNILVARSIKGIIDEYFEPREAKVDFFYYGAKGGVSETIVELIQKIKSDGVSAKISQIKSTNTLQNTQRLSSIHIFDSIENFLSLYLSISWCHAPNRRYEQLIYIPEYTKNDVLKHSNSLVSVNINYLIFNDDSSGEVELVGTYIFNQPQCRKPSVVVINRFRKNTQRWDNSNFFPKPFTNLHGCQLSYNEDMIPLARFLFEIIAQRLNFTTVALKSVLTLDVIGHYFEINQLTIAAGSPTAANDGDDLVFIIPHGEPYTQLEKMFMMFETELWIAIVATFAITLTIIQIINLMSVKVQNFVYGRNIRTPTLNFFNIFLNGSQHQRPGRNFARFILILFIVWSLVIRTCYQSMLFKFLQTDMRKPRLETIEELIENNFTLYHPQTEFTGIDLETIKRFPLRERFNLTEEIVANKFRLNPNYKSTMILYHGFIPSIAKYFRRPELPPIYPLAEKIRSVHFSLFFIKFSPFFERFNELIHRINDHGLALRQTKWAVNDKLKLEKDWEPKVMSMDHLGIGFVIISICFGLSLIVFLMEHIYHRLPAAMKYLRSHKFIHCFKTSVQPVTN